MTRWLGVFLVISFCAQIAFGRVVQNMRAELEVVPDTPSDRSIALSSFGDLQFLHRVYAQQVQDFGDTGGRVTRMVDYDTSKVVDWLDLLDRLDAKSQYQLMLALGYFGATPKPEALEQLLDYASRAVVLQPVNRVHWLREAIVIADRRLKNPDLAIKLADQLASEDRPGLKILAYQLAPLLRAKYGDYAGALAGMRHALTKADDQTATDERVFMEGFIADMQQKLITQGDTGGMLTP